MTPENKIRLVAVVLYFAQLAVKGFAAYLVYLACVSFTGNAIGAIYASTAFLVTFVAAGWKEPEKLAREPEFDLNEPEEGD